MLKTCPACKDDFYTEILNQDICSECENLVKNLLEHPMRYIRHNYKKIITMRSLCSCELSLCIRVKHNIENARKILRDICECLKIQPDVKCSIGDYSIKISENMQYSDYVGEEYYWSEPGSGVMEFKLYLDIEFENNKKISGDNDISELALISSKKCAELGLTDNLPDDALDQVLEFDHLLAVRFLY